MALIEARGLTKLYRMGDAIVRALDGVDLSIDQGEFIAITGASGSGKSTMMHVLGCLDRPTAGAYFFGGRDVSDLTDRELAAIRNKQIGFVFQTFNLINRTTALANVGVPLFYARRTNTRAPALKALERVGLLNRARHQPNEMSGGERQRVAIARAIVNDPLLLLADEPTGNLDTRTGEQIMEIFRRLNEQGVTIVMVTHESDIARQARRIVQMRDGRILSDRPASEVQHLDVTPAERRGQAPTHQAETTTTGPAAVRPPVPLRTRRAPGTTAALVCGLIVPLLWTVAVGAFVFVDMKYRGVVLSPTKPPPGDVIAASGIGLLAVLGSLVMGIVTAYMAHRTLRRIREEPGAWLGRRRAITGAVLGWLGIAAPIVFVAISVVRAVLSATKAGGSGE